jgi:hypothetical protein
MLAFYACSEHANVHRALVMSAGRLVVPQALCGREQRCDSMTVMRRLPFIADPRQVCPDCFPSFVNHAAWLWLRQITVEYDDD